MKKGIILFSAILLLNCASAQTSGSENNKIVMPVEVNLPIDAVFKGNHLDWQDKYDDIQEVIGALIVVKKNEKYGCIDVDDNVRIPIQYDEIYQCPGKEICVRNKNGSGYKYGRYKFNGDLIFPAEYDFVQGYKNGEFHVVSCYNKEGVILYNGKVLAKCGQYVSISDLVGCDTVVILKNKSLLCGLFSANSGEQILPFNYDFSYFGFREKRLSIRKNDLYGFQMNILKK